MNQGLLVVISGASGTGKGTVCSALMESLPEMAYSISATTRQPRKGEQDGVNYYFLSKEDFRKMIAEDGFLEWAEVYGNYYGTPRKKVQEKLAGGQDILLEIDTQGALNVMEKYPAGVFIFLVPPSLEELERRIRKRGTETTESLEARLGAAKKEIGIGRKYTYVVMNDTVDSAVERIRAILTAERCRVPRNTDTFEVLEK